MKSVLVLFGFILAQTASSQQGQPSQQSAPTASIEGVVVRAGTSDGISRAKVTLSPSGSSAAGQAVIVDGDGKFAFRNLTAGQYRLSATKDGYVPAEYGQRGPNGSGVAVNLTGQQHATDIRIGMTSTGAIGGRIVNRYGEPVGNANVQAMRYVYQDGKRVLNTVQTARTNDRGEYRLFWMTPGQYIVSAQPTEQLAVDAGGTIFFQTSRGGPGGPGGPLGGTIPPLGVGGVTRVTITGANSPADLISPIGPGGAAPPPPPPPPPSPVDNPETYLPVYYPGTTDVGAATPIDLRAGGNIDGINLTVVDVKPVRIRGQVTSGGRPAAGAQISLYQRSNLNGNLTVRGMTASDTGAFEFRNVAPGAYEVAASLNGAGPAALIVGSPLGNAARITLDNVGRGGRNSGQPVMGVRVPVDVNASDIDGISLVLENGYNIAGRTTIEGVASNDALSAATGMRIQLQSEPVIPPLAVAPAFPEADGTFSIAGVTAGTYRLSVAGLPRNMYVKTARFSGEDVYNNGLRIEGDPRGQLEIVLGATPGSLDATTVDEKQMPEAGVTVALVPDPSQVKRIDMYRSATSDASGKIHWDGLIPGDYKLFAWEDMENGAWTEPEFMRNFEGRGTSVHIDERGRATVTVKVIPYKAN